ncbi:pilin [Streptomyces sp. NPDC003077]|uniref:pilin n=1 Tax=Streptomyces sp. NPDC003077 TaxID=3154443 RepID=UPI0033A3FCE9
MSPPRQPSHPLQPFRRTGTVLGAAAAACAIVVFTASPVWAVDTIPQVITNLRNWIMGILAGLATLILTIGGLRYLLAGGDPSEVDSAKRAIRAAGIGYGLAVLAPVIVAVLKSIVGSP